MQPLALRVSAPLSLGKRLPEGVSDAHAVTLGEALAPPEGVGAREPDALLLADAQPLPLAEWLALAEGERAPLVLGDSLRLSLAVPQALGEALCAAEADSDGVAPALALALAQREAAGEDEAEALAQPLEDGDGDTEAHSDCQPVALGGALPLPRPLSLPLSEADTLALGEPLREGDVLPLSVGATLADAPRLSLTLLEGEGVAAGDCDAGGLALAAALRDNDMDDDTDALPDGVAAGVALIGAEGEPPASDGVGEPLADAHDVALPLAHAVAELEAHGVAEPEALAQRLAGAEGDAPLLAVTAPLALSLPEGEDETLALPLADSAAVGEALDAPLGVTRTLGDSRVEALSVPAPIEGDTVADAPPLAEPLGERLADDEPSDVALSKALALALTALLALGPPLAVGAGPETVAAGERDCVGDAEAQPDALNPSDVVAHAETLASDADAEPVAIDWLCVALA